MTRSKLTRTYTGTLIVPVVLLVAACGGGQAVDDANTRVVSTNTEMTGAAASNSIEPAANEVAAKDSALLEATEPDTLHLTLWAADIEQREVALQQLLEAADQGMQEHTALDLPSTMALLLTDADPDMRQTTVDSLTDLGGPLAVSLLKEALYDPHPAVRQAAEEGLAELQTPY